MAIGERIRFFRNLRGMTQKWLGQAVGFPQKTADIRMAQYESGSRTPKEDLVKALAGVLEVSPLALRIPDIDTDLGFIHTLFAVEDLHGVRVEKNENEVHIVFDGNKPNVDRSVFQMLAAWAEQAEKYRSGEISKEQYDEWRYTYPEKDTTQPWRRFRAQFSLMPYCSAAAYFVSSPSDIRRPMASRSSKEYFMITSCHRTDSQ